MKGKPVTHIEEINLNAPYYVLSSTPPCVHYEGGENCERLIRVWTYVAGLVGGGFNADDLGRKVVRLYDHKGFLFVVTHSRLTSRVEAVFRDAWVTVGREFEEQVEFLPVYSDRWKCIWGRRRFESD